MNKQKKIKKRYESASVKIWKKQLMIFFFKCYQMKQEKKAALMNSDDDYFNLLLIELSKPAGKRKIFKKKLSIKSSNYVKEKMNEIQYFLNDIYNEEKEHRNAPVKYYFNIF